MTLSSQSEGSRRYVSSVRVGATLACLLIATLLGRADAAPACKPKEATTEFGRWFEAGHELSAQAPNHAVESGFGGTYTSQKLFFSWKTGIDKLWNVVIRAPDYHVLATFGPEDLTAHVARGRWTGRLPYKKVIVDLMARSNSDVVLEIPSGISYPPETSDVRIFSTQQSDPNWSELYTNGSATIKRAGDAVGMLSAGAYGIDGIKRSWCCSGVMISSNVFLTNWHCGGSLGMPRTSYWNSDVCNNSVIDLGWDDSRRSRQYSCSKVIEKSEDLDIALLRVEPTLGTGGNVGQAPQVPILQKTPPVQKIFVVHHALCRPKLVSACQIAPDLNRDPSTSIVKHFCDTEPGASGAPLFDLDGNLIGLHHAGFDRDDQCLPIDKLNKATRIEFILDFIKNRASADFAKLRLN